MQNNNNSENESLDIQNVSRELDFETKSMDSAADLNLYEQEPSSIVKRLLGSEEPGFSLFGAYHKGVFEPPRKSSFDDPFEVRSVTAPMFKTPPVLNTPIGSPKKNKPDKRADDSKYYATTREQRFAIKKLLNENADNEDFLRAFCGIPDTISGAEFVKLVSYYVEHPNDLAFTSRPDLLYSAIPADPEQVPIKLESVFGKSMLGKRSPERMLSSKLIKQAQPFVDDTPLPGATIFGMHSQKDIVDLVPVPKQKYSHKKDFNPHTEADIDRELLEDLGLLNNHSTVVETLANIQALQLPSKGPCGCLPYWPYPHDGQVHKSIAEKHEKSYNDDIVMARNILETFTSLQDSSNALGIVLIFPLLTAPVFTGEGYHQDGRDYAGEFAFNSTDRVLMVNQELFAKLDIFTKKAISSVGSVAENLIRKVYLPISVPYSVVWSVEGLTHQETKKHHVHMLLLYNKQINATSNSKLLNILSNVYGSDLTTRTIYSKNQVGYIFKEKAYVAMTSVLPGDGCDYPGVKLSAGPYLKRPAYFEPSCATCGWHRPTLLALKESDTAITSLTCNKPKHLYKFTFDDKYGIPHELYPLPELITLIESYHSKSLCLLCSSAYDEAGSAFKFIERTGWDYHVHSFLHKSGDAEFKLHFPTWQKYKDFMNQTFSCKAAFVYRVKSYFESRIVLVKKILQGYLDIPEVAAIDFLNCFIRFCKRTQNLPIHFFKPIEKPPKEVFQFIVKDALPERYQNHRQSLFAALSSWIESTLESASSQQSFKKVLLLGGKGGVGKTMLVQLLSRGLCIPCERNGSKGSHFDRTRDPELSCLRHFDEVNTTTIGKVGDPNIFYEFQSFENPRMRLNQSNLASTAIEFIVATGASIRGFPSIDEFADFKRKYSNANHMEMYHDYDSWYQQVSRRLDLIILYNDSPVESVKKQGSFSAMYNRIFSTGPKKLNVDTTSLFERYVYLI